MANDVTQPSLAQDNRALIKQLQAALSARQQQPEPVPAATFNPEEQRQFARFGLDPQRLRFLNTLAQFRQGMNLDKDLVGRAMKGETSPSVGNIMGDEELAPYA